MNTEIDGVTFSDNVISVFIDELIDVVLDIVISGNNTDLILFNIHFL